jgi:hypothetical protein
MASRALASGSATFGERQPCKRQRPVFQFLPVNVICNTKKVRSRRLCPKATEKCSPEEYALTNRCDFGYSTLIKSKPSGGNFNRAAKTKNSNEIHYEKSKENCSSITNLNRDDGIDRRGSS